MGSFFGHFWDHFLDHFLVTFWTTFGGHFGADDPGVIFTAGLGVIFTAGLGVIVTSWRLGLIRPCLLYTSPSPRDYAASRMPSSA